MNRVDEQAGVGMGESSRAEREHAAPDPAGRAADVFSASTVPTTTAAPAAPAAPTAATASAAPTAARRRSPVTPVERGAIVAVGVALVGFAIYGVVSSAPSTVGYLTSVVVVGALIGWFRREPLPGALSVALAVDAVAHLAGGMVVVGNEVLYDFSIGPGDQALDTHLFQYDHLVHGYGSMLATIALWFLLVPPELEDRGRGSLITLCALAGMGIGAANELIEFIATLAHHGAHVGGYTNTGWDLVANTVGATIGAVVLVVWRPVRAAR